MKKTIFTLILGLLTLMTYAEPFFIRVNGTTDYPANPTGVADFQGRTQYLASSVPLLANDVVTCYDGGAGAEWALTNLDPYGEYQKFTITSTGIKCTVAGCYDFYIKLKFEDDMMYIGEGTGCGDNPDPNPNPNPNPDPDPNPIYAKSVPNACPDVMLQAFYYDSYGAEAPGYVGKTKWADLIAQSSEIGAYFDLVWLPPSAKSDGGTGYHPAQYSNQNSTWGSRTELEQFISLMHAANTRVIADIVINHAANKTNWCDYYVQDFGQYGVFNPDVSWICRTDEVNSSPDANSSCAGKATGTDDGGYNMQDNYASARDWAHAKPEVQNMMKAYLQWMKNVMGYDGWRYDYAQGFKGKYIDMYNKAAKNYFSVVEFWNGDVNNIRAYLNDVNWNTLAFDFGTKYTAINQGIADGNWQNCRGAGLLGQGLSKYAVTFVDSHDTYYGCTGGRQDQSEIAGCQRSMLPTNKWKVLAANAYILSMPGVPCVFYPHWHKYKTEIGPMILARHATGVHSESPVNDEAGNGYYKATITGTKGTIKLFLGPNSGYETCPAGYVLAYKGTNCGMYYNSTAPVSPVLIVEPGSKTFKDNVEGLTISMRAIGGSGTATIYFTLDGTDPKTSTTKQTYAAPFKITTTTTVKAYAVAGGETAVQEYTYTYKAPQTTPIIVKFRNSAGWPKVYLYAWDNGAPDMLGSWPGTEIQPTGGWYEYQFADSIKSTYFIFNGGVGKAQTGDLWTDEDVCYGWTGGADGSEKLLPDCSYTGVEEVVVNNETISIYPNPVRNILNINTTQPIQAAEVYDITGQLKAQFIGTDTQIEVGELSSGMYVLRVLNANGTTNSALFLKE